MYIHVYPIKNGDVASSQCQCSGGTTYYKSVVDAGLDAGFYSSELRSLSP